MPPSADSSAVACGLMNSATFSRMSAWIASRCCTTFGRSANCVCSPRSAARSRSVRFRDQACAPRRAAPAPGAAERAASPQDPFPVPRSPSAPSCCCSAGQALNSAGGTTWPSFIGAIAKPIGVRRIAMPLRRRLVAQRGEGTFVACRGSPERWRRGASGSPRFRTPPAATPSGRRSARPAPCPAPAPGRGAARSPPADAVWRNC